MHAVLKILEQELGISATALGSKVPQSLPDMTAAPQTNADSASKLGHDTCCGAARDSPAVPDQAPHHRLDANSAKSSDQDIGHLSTADVNSLPDQDSAALVLSHVRSLISACCTQRNELTQQLEQCSVESHAAASILYTAMQQQDYATDQSNVQCTMPCHATSAGSISQSSSAACSQDVQSHAQSVQSDSLPQDVQPHAQSSQSDHRRIPGTQSSATLRAAASSCATAVARQQQGGESSGSFTGPAHQSGLQQTVTAAAEHIRLLLLVLRERDGQIRQQGEQLRDAQSHAAESESCAVELSQQLAHAQKGLQQVMLSGQHLA